MISAPLVFIGNRFELVSFDSSKLLFQTKTAKALSYKDLAVLRLVNLIAEKEPMVDT